ncbi:MAG: hypothetical protein AAGA63_09940 [Pseudomonadota bacterium]
MAKVPIEEFPIHVYTPMKSGQKYVALIGNLHFVFRGDTPLKAKQKAEDWRTTEIAKVRARRKKIDDAQSSGEA